MLIRVLAVLVALGSTAAAQMIDVQLKNQVRAGEKPSLSVRAPVPIARVRVELTRDDGHAVVLEHGPVRANESARLDIADAQAGHARWRGTLVATFSDGNRGSYELNFETAVTGELRVSYAREHLDLEGRTLEFQMSRPAGAAELHVFADDGEEIGKGSANFHGEKPGAWLPITWTQARPGNVLRLELRATSADGLATLVKLLPWSVRIPHEEVVFETGKAEIRPSEEAKLDASYQRIVDAAAKVRKADPKLEVKVFIAGHTDTVGNAADNRKLSLERARAIASWFRDRGLPLPISYAGFGEDALKVKTPDNTDEAANRRADYIVAVEPPLVARGVRPSWHPLNSL
jgi:outer membrane protein OmpA-like peptidoglycan-associated protein